MSNVRSLPPYVSLLEDRLQIFHSGRGTVRGLVDSWQGKGRRSRSQGWDPGPAPLPFRTC